MRSFAGPSDAEIARTLSLGRLPGQLTIDGRPPIRTRHAAPGGRLLLLAHERDPLAEFVRAEPRGEPRARLSVDDIPPLPESPGLGQVVLAGTLHRLDATEAAAIVHDFAAANPAPELLDVGDSAAIYGMRLDGICLRRRGIERYVGVCEYLVAEADPLHGDERDLLLDLADHHGSRIEPFFRHVLSAAGVSCRATPRAVRVDRYGFTVDLGPPARPSDHHWARLEFSRVLDGQRDLARLLHPVLFHRHRHTGPWASPDPR